MITKISSEMRLLASQVELQSIIKEHGLKPEDVPKNLEEALQVFKDQTIRTASLKSNILVGAIAFFIGNSLIPIDVGRTALNKVKSGEAREAIQLVLEKAERIPGKVEHQFQEILKGLKPKETPSPERAIRPQHKKMPQKALAPQKLIELDSKSQEVWNKVIEDINSINGMAEYSQEKYRNWFLRYAAYDLAKECGKIFSKLSTADKKILRRALANMIPAKTYKLGPDWVDQVITGNYGVDRWTTKET